MFPGIEMLIVPTKSNFGWLFLQRFEALVDCDVYVCLWVCLSAGGQGGGAMVILANATATTTFDLVCVVRACRMTLVVIAFLCCNACGRQDG